MRKLLMALACLFVMAGLAFATEVTLIKFDKDKKEVTVKHGEKETTYKITDRSKFSTTDKDGNTKELSYADAVKGLSSEKAAGKMKFDITVKGDELTEAKMKGRKKN